MPLVNAQCTRCKADIQIDGTNKTGFCLRCGARVVVSEAVQNFQKSHENDEPLSPAEAAGANSVIEDLMLQAEAFLGQGVFDAAESTYRSIISREPQNWQAHWGFIKAKTNNLDAYPINNTEDYAYHFATDLFQNADLPEKEEWKAQYMDGLQKSCYKTIDSIDPRVFLEVEIFRWYPEKNTFMYPISRGFDLQNIFDKVLWENWNVLKAALPENCQAEFLEHGEACCRKIWDYFDSGFANMEELRNGNLTRLMGAWQLKLTTGAVKADVLRFSTNSVSVPHLETCRLKFNHYDYYRFIKMDASNHILAAEHRHFPSSMGMGGDFLSHPQYEAVIGVMAVYDYILVLPTALYIRTEPKKIPGYDRALQFQLKCRTMPCFQRSGLKSAIQVRPISDNHDTGDATKKVKACYIATAVYGSVDAPEVLRLRRFRDETLHKYHWGRRFSSFYYRHSPQLAERLEGTRIVNVAVRSVLNVFVKILK